MTRIVLLDCHATGRTFVADSAFRALAGELRREGFDADLLDLVRDDPESGRSMADLVPALREKAPHLVIVSRAWSASLVEELRAAAGAGARIVRHSHGAPSAIDDRFDAVLDAEGIRHSLAGRAAPTPAWRKTRSELAVAQHAPEPTALGQATISGPAHGCPFLVDVRSSPAYAGSGIDFERIQSKGCSFCLDNVGAYASFPSEVVVESWLSQLRTLRGQRPELRQVLLTDERPHPHLPAFFQAVLDEPGLHGIELLIKSRVDWLEEFADTALAAACDLAARSASVLHLYLVGFESFHQPDLDLFNKAVTVSDNLRAISTLRSLELRHPASFEFRRLGMHGIILFHPWTTPDSLLDNAQRMREVRFEQLRSQALRTRLRLYPSVPLHALAERDRLLVDEFDSGRDDRAVEQGYDASVPWKFGDTRIEAIFRAANRIAADLPELCEADVLEMVTRFVLRWPTFADAPDLAALPVLQALFSWGAVPEDVMSVAGPTVAGFHPEVEAVAAGDKPASLTEAVAVEDAEGLVSAYRRMGLAAAIVSRHRRGGDDGHHGCGDSHAIVAVARDAATLERVLERQRSVERGEKPSAVEAMGELMGYPACCVKTYATKLAHDENLDLERAALRALPDRILSPLLNRLGSVHLISHFPCAPDCVASIELAGTRLAAIARLDDEAAERLITHLSRPVLRLDYRRGAVLDGEWEGERFAVRSLRPFTGADFGIEPAAVTALRLSTDRVFFEAAGGQEHSVAAVAPILAQPGAALASAAVRALEGEAKVGRESHRPAVPAPASAAVPGLSGLLADVAVGSQAGDFIVEKVESYQDAICVTLSRRAESLRVHLRPWDATRPALSRRGAWGLDLDPGVLPSDSARKAVGALARRLPAGDHQAEPGNGSKAAPGIPIRPAPSVARAGVVCTAPWTTLEVVDPDGRARQCCADWTVGDRGNLHQLSLAEVWNGAGYRMARRVMAGDALEPLCHRICPRLYDRKFAERELSFVPGAPAFADNQRVLFEDIAARREVVRARPLYVAVCPSTYCNYDCIMCLHGRTPRRDLPESIWDDLLSMLPTLRVLTLLGGEPLANPLAMKFLRDWDRTRYPDASVSIVTNGSLLTAGVLASLERCRFGGVTVSLNAGTPEVYENVQRGLALEQVLANVDALRELRRRQGSDFPIVLSFVVQPANHLTLEQFGGIARARDLPIRLMPLSPRGPEGLDYYDDAEEVARVLASLDAMATWAEEAAPGYRSEIQGTRAAIAAEAGSRRSAVPLRV